MLKKNGIIKKNHALGLGMYSMGRDASAVYDETTFKGPNIDFLGGK